MALKNRNALKTLFTGGVIPTKENYADLIDSMLNRKDDHFFGVWQQGKRYCQGDVVIYGKSLYLLNIQDVEELVLCPGDTLPEDDQQGEMQQQKVYSTQETAPADPLCICSDIPPPDDKERWCELQLEVDDRDWEVVLDEEGGEPLIVHQIRARIGMGTDDPGTRLQVSGSAGDIQADPDGSNPTVSLLSRGERACRVDWSLDETVQYLTDSLGYAFFRQPKPSSESGAKPKGMPAPTLLFFLTEEGNRPAAGVGTDRPKGILHVEDEGYGRLVVNHRKGNEAATVLLVNCTDGGNGHYLLSGVNQNYAYWQTDASQGLRIIMGGSYDKLSKEMGQGLTAVAVDREGRVGIGTEKPRSKLEVTEANMGSVRVDFSNDNVSISALNERPRPQRPATYHALGVDDEFATLITDAPSGFAFKAGRQTAEGQDYAVDINQGEIVGYLTRTGRLGLRTPHPPEDFDLHVNGHQLSQTAYLETNGKRIVSDGKLDGAEVLEQLQKLHPIYFNWRSSANAADAGRQIGFNAQNVFECFPELTRQLEKDKTVAYGNLTAVLTAAIKEQQRLIRELDQRVSDLEEQLHGKSENL
ncbi:hypothetical protein GGR26_002575 [Lewinella marina]|uniref:Peptidase S74 domain-containing protein n=1 Tax=Neolewinella marina TaxID=438751 RepID=A0A2G0CB57_9BACT|nr:tail fiber domain-containing protein [Neolewinella marina]NJB86798.1 hypothetical protein [Neolewinella marina]PHK97190.1 hypothetical protein CGL56_17265 [Neolewinella marina]